MEIKELRLDNTVNVKRSKEARGVTVEDFRLAIDGENPYLTPVKLTADWLLKLGFLHLGIGFVSFDNLLFVYYNDDIAKYELFLYKEVEEDVYLINCEHVHQLQNLYFALTGKELTLKEMF